MSQEVLEKQYKQGTLINWGGFISTSNVYKESLKFACRKNQDPNLVSVMFSVWLENGVEGGYSFELNQPCYTQYPEEDEILLDDGLPFYVKQVQSDIPIEGYGQHYKGRKITKVTMESRFPENIVPYQEIKLHSNCNFY